jgi:hypothetical protein
MAIITRASMRSRSSSQRGTGTRHPALEVGAHQQHRPVFGEVVPVVLEDAQALGLDLRIRRVEVHHVQRASAETAVGELVLQPPHLRLGQPVGTLQRAPAVCPVDELAAEAEPKSGMGTEVRDSPDASRSATSSRIPRA